MLWKYKKNQKYAKLNILFTELLGYGIHFGISWLFFKPTYKNMQMHTNVGSNHYTICPYYFEYIKII